MQHTYTRTRTPPHARRVGVSRLAEQYPVVSPAVHCATISRANGASRNY
jgi:hypothetical protein